MGSISYPSEIEWRFESENEFVHLIQLHHLVTEVTGAAVRLVMPYLPYARQDKQIDDLLTFALRPFLKTLATMPWASVATFDPHSDVLLEYFPDAMCVRPNIDRLTEQHDAVCFPDAGAASRYATTKPVLIGDKVRDQSTGRITAYSVTGEAAGRVLVVDDICDGGATFELLGAALKERGLTADLYVSHGIFSRGIEHLTPLYGRIITTNSLPQKAGVEVRECFA